MRAIVTKYIGPTNHRGARMTAQMGEKKITIPYAYEFNTSQNHEIVGLRLAIMLGHGANGLHTASLPDGRYCHIPA